MYGYVRLWSGLFRAMWSNVGLCRIVLQIVILHINILTNVKPLYDGCTTYLPYGQNPDLYASPEQNAREKTQRFLSITLVCN